MAFESWAVREMTRAPAVAAVREEIIQDCIRSRRSEEVSEQVKVRIFWALSASSS